MSSTYYMLWVAESRAMYFQASRQTHQCKSLGRLTSGFVSGTHAVIRSIRSKPFSSSPSPSSQCERSAASPSEAAPNPLAAPGKLKAACGVSWQQSARVAHKLKLSSKVPAGKPHCQLPCSLGTKKVSPRRTKPLREAPTEVRTAPGPFLG